jgi:Protein of unknown function (DUF3303)
MLFVTTVRTPSNTYKATMERFKAGGGLPPAGVKMIGRWSRADGSGCTVVCETDDAVALAKWSAEWADVISIEIAPVLTDAEMASVLS